MSTACQDLTPTNDSINCLIDRSRGRGQNRRAPKLDALKTTKIKCCKSQHNFTFQFDDLSHIRIGEWNRVAFCNTVVLIDLSDCKFYLIISKD